MNDLIILLIGMAIGIVIQLVYSLIQLFKEPEKMIEACQSIIDLKDYRDRGY